MTIAKQKADAGFEIMQKLGIEYFCFHDTDLVGDLGEDIADYEARMHEITAYLKEKMAATGIKNLWGPRRYKLCVLGRPRGLYEPSQH